MNYKLLTVSALAVSLVAGSIGFAGGVNIPGRPAQSRDDLTLPNDGQPYFKFAYKIKEALDRDYPESNALGGNLDNKIRKGGGVYVRLTDDVYNVHIGYKASADNGGENSGRSYGIGPARSQADDLTYPQLLDIMEKYMKETRDLKPFFRAIYKVLVFSDSSGIEAMGNDREGKTLVSDVIAIYGAELNRNIMSDLESHDWQKHLMDVTMLAALHASTGIVWNADFGNKAGKIDRGPLKLMIGHGTGGSGFGGKGGIKRRGFQRQLTAALKEANAPLYKKIQAAIGHSSSDVFHGTQEHINDDSISNGNAIVNTMVELADYLRTNGEELTNSLN